ncbi:MAG: hypothetical protein ABJE47_12695 [bacterium]
MTTEPRSPDATDRPSSSPSPSRIGDAGRSDAELLDYYRSVLRRHARVIVAVPLIVSVVALGLSLSRQRSYAAHAAFLVSEPSSASSTLGSLTSIASQLGVPALGAIAQGSASFGPQFYGDLLNSNALVHAIVMTRFDAGSPGEFGGNPFTGTLVEYLDGNGKTQSDREIDAMKRFGKKALAVAVDRPTGVVRFEVKTKNRLLSALVARRMLDLINDFNLRRRQTQAGAERDFSARRATAARDTLRNAEAELAEFRTTNIDFSRSPRLATRETELQRRVSMAQQIYTTVAQRYESANIEAVRNTPLITVLDAPEGLVESLPRHSVGIAAGALVAALVLTCLGALFVERLRADRAPQS